MGTDSPHHQYRARGDAGQRRRPRQRAAFHPDRPRHRLLRGCAPPTRSAELLEDTIKDYREALAHHDQPLSRAASRRVRRLPGEDPTAGRHRAGQGRYSRRPRPVRARHRGPDRAAAQQLLPCRAPLAAAPAVIPAGFPPSCSSGAPTSPPQSAARPKPTSASASHAQPSSPRSALGASVGFESTTARQLLQRLQLRLRSSAHARRDPLRSRAGAAYSRRRRRAPASNRPQPTTARPR